MIRYNLNYLDDFLNDVKIYKVIGIISKDFSLEEKSFLNNIDIKNIELLISTDSMTISNCVIDNQFIEIRQLDYLLHINLEGYILIILSNYIDYVKDELNKYNKLINIKCYTKNFNCRYYFDVQRTINTRWVDPNIFWYRKALINSNERIDEIDLLLANRRIQLENKEIKCLPRLIVTVTTKCNLICQDCLALTGMYKKHKDFECEKLICSINKILDVVDKISCIELLGGEPFLYKNLWKLINFLTDSHKVEMVQITSNGIIEPNPKLIAVMKDPKVMVRISNYNVSESTAKTIECLNNNGVKTVVQNNLLWVPVGDLKNRNKTIHNLRDEYAWCFEGINCKNLFGSKLFACTFASRCFDLNIGKDVEFLDISKNITWDELFNFWISTYSFGCNYCNMMNPNVRCIMSGIQLSPSQKK